MLKNLALALFLVLAPTACGDPLDDLQVQCECTGDLRGLHCNCLITAEEREKWLVCQCAAGEGSKLNCNCN